MTVVVELETTATFGDGDEAGDDGDISGGGKAGDGEAGDDGGIGGGGESGVYR